MIEKNVNGYSLENIHTDAARNSILRDIATQVLSFTSDQGVHPGDIAITFDEHDCQFLFEQFGEEQIKNLEAITASKFESKARIPIPSSDIDESVLFPHNSKLTDCKCKFFIGPYRKLKGLTVKVIIFISIQGTTMGHNRLAAYTSLSRSSCAFVMFYVRVKDMKMQEYQLKKMKFYKKLYGDGGSGRSV